MVRDTRLAQTKMIQDDIASNHKTRKIENLKGPSLDKLATSGRKVPESFLRGSVRAERGGLSRCYINSDKRANEFPTKNTKDDLRIGFPSTCIKAKNSTSPPRIRSSSICGNGNKSTSPRRIISSSPCDVDNKRRNEDDGSASSSTENSIRSPKVKLQKINAEFRTSRETDGKGEGSGKKTIRKHLHVHAYKKLFTKHAKAGGNHGNKCVKDNSPPQGLLKDLGANASKEVKVGGDVGKTKEGVQDERELRVETIESLEKKDLKITQLLESSGKEVCNHDPSEMNVESRPYMLEELGVGDGGVCNSEFLGTPMQQISEENIFVVSKDSTNTQTEHNLCYICKQPPGQLLRCCGKGCKKSCHLFCFDPLLHDVPPGSWLCNFCVKKKNDLGPYSVSDGIESVWAVDEGMQRGRRYLVKYKGVAHVHNRWILESELLHDAPSLVANFGKKGPKEINKWRKEWAEAERLLQKRLVALLEVADEYTSASVFESSNYCIEWFVKWKGLKYDQATWELENSLLQLCSSDAPRLIKEYEYRCEQTSRSYDPLRADKALQVKKDPFCKMSKLHECPVELDNDYLSSVNCLREFWYKSLNAVLIDGQERIPKSILFVLSLQSHACRPSLIITTSGSLQLWQADFLLLAPSVNVIMYRGDKDVRKMIQNFEFYDERGRLMFQVLLADRKAVVEDLVDIGCIGWESIIVDECQNSNTTRYLEQLNTLSTDFKLVLFNGQLKDSLSDYRILLSFLNAGGTMDNGLVVLNADSNDAPTALTKLKEKLARHIVFECKTDSSKFLEYWVPVPLSSVQLEQYCSTLFSNATVLRSNLRSDVVGALHNALITIRKCCDHPYLVDGELRDLLTKGLQGPEFFNAEVCASGKLYLLGKILQGMKDCGLRVVIIFQSLGGAEKVSLGDMLDDFLQQRFGVNTYERIETGMVMAKKVAALKKFNNEETGKFVFLIEKRACLPSVKLHSVDAIILFNSDWNPLNDVRSLQKIIVESQHNCTRVFRFYTSYTVEEKLLMLAKQDIILESGVESLSRNISHLLLGWGASYLFRKLDQLHSRDNPTCISEPSFDKLCMNDVLFEILTHFPGKTEPRTVPCSVVMKAQLTGGIYSQNIVLAGEKEGISLPEKDLPSFWSGLLEGRHPKWMYISEHSQRIRRKIHNANGFTIQAVDDDKVKRKRRKLNEHAPEEIRESCMLESEGGRQKLEDQRNLLMLLKPELSELCDILGLPESVKGVAQEFLFYVMNNHDVSSNKVTVLQALKVSLCWRAASMLRHNLDRGGSLSLAKKHLKFECTEKEACSVYSKLQILKEKFSYPSGALGNLSERDIMDNQSPPSKKVEDVRETLDGRAMELAAAGSSSLGVIDEYPISYKTTSERMNSQQGCHPIGDPPGKLQLDIGSLKDNPPKNQINAIEEFFLRRSEDLVKTQQAEISIFKKQMYKNRLKLEKIHEFALALIRSIHIDEKVRNGKINVLTKEFSDKLGRFDQHCKRQKKKLMSMQLDMSNKEQGIKYSWLEKAKTGTMAESVNVIPRLESRVGLEKCLDASEFIGICDISGATILNSACNSGETDTGSEGCLEVPSNVLKEREENGRKGDDPLASSPSVIGDNLEQVVQNRLSVEPAVSSGLSGVLPFDSGISTPQSEVSGPSIRPADLINGSIAITATAFNLKQQECRDDSNGLPLVPNPELNQGALLSSVQGLASFVPASTLPSIQELCANGHARPEALTSGNNECLDSAHEVAIPASDSVVTPSPHIEMMSCNDTPPSNFTSCPLPLPEHEERLPPAGNQEYLPSEGIPTEHLRGTTLQCSVVCDLSHSSTQTAEVPVQDVIEAAVSEIEPSIQQISENNLHHMRPQEYLPLERTHSEHLRGTGIQLDDPNQLFQNFPSMEWVVPQAIFADPISNELFRVNRQHISNTKKHENKKLLLQTECEQEIEKVRRKYNILLHDAEIEYLNEKKVFQEIFEKIFWHKIFAEEVWSKFCDHKKDSSTSFQAPSQNSSQHLQASRPQPQLASRPSSSSPPTPLSTESRLHTSQTTNQASSTAPVLPTLRPQAAVPAITSFRSAGISIKTSPVISSDPVRGTINLRANLRVGCLNPRPSLHLSRSPAPHLQRVRPPHASGPTDKSPLSSAASLQPAPPSLVSAAIPAVPPPNLVYTFQAPISNTYGMSQPTASGSAPLYLSPPQFELPQHAEADDLLESLLANLPATEFHTESAIGSRPNASPDYIYLSD